MTQFAVIRRWCFGIAGGLSLLAGSTALAVDDCGSFLDAVAQSRQDIRQGTLKYRVDIRSGEQTRQVEVEATFKDSKVRCDVWGATREAAGDGSESVIERESLQTVLFDGTSLLSRTESDRVSVTAPGGGTAIPGFDPRSLDLSATISIDKSPRACLIASRATSCEEVELNGEPALAVHREYRYEDSEPILTSSWYSLKTLVPLRLERRTPADVTVIESRYDASLGINPLPIHVSMHRTSRQGIELSRYEFHLIDSDYETEVDDSKLDYEGLEIPVGAQVHDLRDRAVRYWDGKTVADDFVPAPRERKSSRSSSLAVVLLAVSAVVLALTVSIVAFVARCRRTE